MTPLDTLLADNARLAAANAKLTEELERVTRERGEVHTKFWLESCFELRKWLVASEARATAAETARDAALEHVARLREATELLIKHAGTTSFHPKEMCLVMLSDVKEAARVFAETAPAEGGGDG